MLKHYAITVCDELPSLEGIFPDPTKDAERFSNLHSWYKHLGSFQKAYPILMKGEEPQNNFAPSYLNLDQENYHWRFILDYNLEGYGLDYGNVQLNEIPNDVMNFAKRFPIYISYHLGDEINDAHKFHITNCKMMAMEFWDELQKIAEKEVSKDIEKKEQKSKSAPKPEDIAICI